MDKNAKIYVAGHRGLVGSALIRQLKKQGYDNIISRTHTELDLTNQSAVQMFFDSEKPEYVILAAAKVGGIHANNTYPAEFIHENLAIQTNIIHHSYLAGVKRLLFLGSSCIYPRDCQQPIKEEYLLTGELEPTNRPYALAKIAGIEMCWAYNRQYGTKFIAAMPTNCYGPEDNYDPDTSHVLPALIRKIHEAKSAGSHEITIWGTGKPKREFIYSDDLAEGCIFLLSLNDFEMDKIVSVKDAPPVFNVGTGVDNSILDIAKTIAGIIGFEGEINFDLTKPDGTPRKLLSIERMKNLGWSPKYDLIEGIQQAYLAYKVTLESDQGVQVEK